MLQLILGEIQAPASHAAAPGQDGGCARATRSLARGRGIAAMIALVIALGAALALADSPLPRLLVAHRWQAEAVLPSWVEGRGRIAAVQADVGGGENAVTTIPRALDLAFVTSCPSTTGVVDIEVTVNGRRLGDVQNCVPHSLGASGATSLEAFWSSYGARPGARLRVGVRARVRSLAGGVQRMVPSVVYLGVYEAAENAVPTGSRAVAVASDERIVARVALDAAHPRVPLLVLQQQSHPLTFSGSCGGEADGLGYTLLAAGHVVGRMDCDQGPGVHPLDLAALPPAGIRDGVLTLAVALDRSSGEPLVDHPPSATARAVVTIYGRRTEGLSIEADSAHSRPHAAALSQLRSLIRSAEENQAEHEK